MGGYEKIFDMIRNDIRRLLEENDDDSFVRDVQWEKSKNFKDTGMYTIYLETDDGEYEISNAIEYDEVDWMTNDIYNILQEEKQRFIENCTE